MTLGEKDVQADLPATINDRNGVIENLQDKLGFKELYDGKDFSVAKRLNRLEQKLEVTPPYPSPAKPNASKPDAMAKPDVAYTTDYCKKLLVDDDAKIDAIKNPVSKSLTEARKCINLLSEQIEKLTNLDNSEFIDKLADKLLTKLKVAPNGSSYKLDKQ
ncbi:MAG: hypothetical protein WCP16_24115 [Pseudanabaena sp. ELA645]